MHRCNILVEVAGHPGICHLPFHEYCVFGCSTLSWCTFAHYVGKLPNLDAEIALNIKLAPISKIMPSMSMNTQND